MERTRVGIIGTAGRKEDFNKLSKKKFLLMLNKAEEYIRDVLMLSFEDVCFVSGGAAWADHIAVQLFMKYVHCGAQLELYLPAEPDGINFQFSEGKYTDIKSSRYDPGRIANYYHRLFQDSTGIPSMKEIVKSSLQGARIHVHPGFKERNTLVAENVDFLIAFTFGEGNEPKDGGTADTWDKCSAPKIHFPVHMLK